ncbi:MAG: FlgD immunoglobulin-like domain containing protein [Armatimonadota bacterium]
MSKFRFNHNLLSVALISACAAGARADFLNFCAGPAARFSPGFLAYEVQSPIFAVSMGIAGTVDYNSGAEMPPGCFGAHISGNVRGRIGFGAGTLGTIHSTIDDNMGMTWGFHPARDGITGVCGTSAYAILTEDTTTSLFGANGFQTAFIGLSDTYFFARTTNGNTRIECRIDLVADSARVNWVLQNTDTVSHTIGLGFGSTVALFSETLQEIHGASPSTSPDGTYVTVPGIKPPRTEHRWTRSLDPAGFPSSVNFAWSQPEAVGIQIMNTKDSATTDPNDPSQSQTSVDGFVLGNANFLIGWASGVDANAFSNFIFQEPISDVGFAANDSYIQTWNPQLVGAGASRTINAFYRSTWGDSLYGRPYSVVADTPKVINLAQGDANQFAQNPFPIRVWVDNNRGFASIDTELPLQDVQVQLLLPDGMTIVGPSIKTIANIDARKQGFVDFLVQVDSFAAGDMTYQVKVTPTPGPQKTLSGVIQVIAQPKMTLRTDANLITSPWTFDSPTWENILGLVPDQDYQAFTYDPVQKGYIVSTGPDRGHGAWIISKIATTNIQLGSNPQAPTDYKPQNDGSGGAPLISLKPGWNLIGNPYHVAFQLGQIVGASNANPNQSYTYVDLVKQNLISGSLAYWDPSTVNYGFIQKTTDHVEPQRGYWIFVPSSQDVVIRFPPIFQVGVRSQSEVTKPWQQTDKQWRLQIAARTNSAADDQNFVGFASSAANAKSLRVYEPPMAPTKNGLSLAVDQNVDGTQTRMSQSLSDGAGRQEFIVKVDSRESGPVTVTWPNLSTIPKNVRAKLVDVATGETRDLRKVSGYTFQAEGNLTRSFKIQLEPGTVSKAIIGSVVVTQTGRAQGASIRLNYTLGSDATTTVRILSSNGREVMVVGSGRADKAGQNEVVWNLRDQANRAVAPGTYRAEIVAEGADGERVRKITPIIVIR